MKKTIIITLTLFLFACQNHKKADVDENPYSDQHSFANMHEVVITHLDLFLEIDFAGQIIHGVNTIEYSKINPNAKQLILDSNNLKIKSIRQTTEEGFHDINWQWGQSAEYLGTALIIELPDNNQPISISYQTVPEASGLQWLNPAQTAGKKQPFLFTQSQPIHARTWIPLQDSPKVRQTYNGSLREKTMEYPQTLLYYQ
ncbi:MAG: hypothetical protein L3J52_10225 [Proteobacteria bacterium]|nr:hypothetical protein [Pseudomonadota bacterium]